MVTSLFKTLFKTIKWLLIILLIVIVLALAASWYLLGTESGYRKLPSLINSFTPYTLTYDALEGHLFTEQRWQGFKLEGPTINMVADELIVNLNTAALKDKHLHLKQLALNDAKIVLLNSEQPQSESEGIPNELPQIDLPIDIDIDQVTLSDVEIWQENIKLTTISQAQLSAHYAEQTLNFSTTADFTQGNLQLAGELQTNNDYPLTLQGTSRITIAEDVEQAINVQADQSLLNPNILVQMNGFITTELTLTGAIDLQAQILDLKAAWQELDYQAQYQSAGGVITAVGAFDDLTLTLNGDLTGQTIPPIDLQGQANLTETGIDNVAVVIALLGGEINFNGDVQYSPTLNWQGVLKIDDIVAQRYYEDIDGHINGLITTKGEQNNGVLNAQLLIDELSGQWQGSPINGHGSVIYEDNALNVNDLSLNLAGNTLNANGTMIDESLDMHLAIQANHLGRLLPGIEGQISGEVTLTDTVSNPTINADIAWQALAYNPTSDSADEDTPNEVPFFTSSNGELTIDGELAAMNVALQGAFSGADIPQSDIELTAVVSPNEINNIDLLINTLDGEIAATGDVVLTPQIEWNIEAQVRDVNAGEYVEGLDGALTADVKSVGSVIEGQVSTQTNLSDLSGQWQGNPLAGNAAIEMIDGQLAIKGMDIEIGDNQLTLTGDLNPEDLDVEFSLDGTDLSAFYPGLGGSLNGEGTLTGNAKSPLAKMRLKGQNISFQDNKVASINVDIDSSMVDGGAFNNHIELTGVEAAGQRWQRILFDSKGTYNQHSIDLQTTGGEVNVNLAATGGFTAIDSWSGELSQLTVTGYDLNWRMASPTQVAYSPEQVTVDDFCMVDSYSNICLDLEKADDTQITYRVDTLDSRSFDMFLPENMRIEPKVIGDGSLVVDNNGNINGDADINLTPGTFFYQPENAAPITLVLERGELTSQFNNGQADLALDVVFRDAGVITGQARISDFAQPSIAGRLGVNIPDIGEFQYFIPKVSELKGSIAGELRFSGRLPEPQVTGEILLENGAVKIPEYATDLQDIRLRLSAVQTGQIDISGNIGTPEGDLTTQGQLELSPLILRLSLDGQNMLIANSKEARVIISPSIEVNIDPNTGVNVTGEIFVPEARIAVPDRSNAVQVSDDVVILTGDETREDVVPLEEGSPIRANITITLGDAVFFQAPQVKLRLIGGLDVIMLPGQPIKGRGVIEVENGIYVLYGQELDIRRGRITFTGDDITNPTIEVLALREIDDVDAGAQITGTAQNLVLTLTSDPTLPDSAILSYLLFGRPPDSAMDNEALLQTAATISLGGVFPTNLAEQTGLDVFDLGVSGLKAGKYLGEDLYVGIRSNFFTAVSQFVARYQFNDRLSAEATAQANENAIDFLYEYETD